MKVLPPLRIRQNNKTYPTQLANLTISSQKIVSSEPNEYEEHKLPQDSAPLNTQKKPALTCTAPSAKALAAASLVGCVIGLILLIVLPVYLVDFETTIIIAGTNDIHGKFYPNNLVRMDTNQVYREGGLVFMSYLIGTVKQQYEGNLLYLDAGDQFQGGIESSPLVSAGQIMNDFYNVAGLAGSAIGNHQFDFGPNFLWSYFQGRKSDNLAANIRSEQNKQEFMLNQKNKNIYQIKNGIKVGVIGLATLQTPSTTATFASGQFPRYKFEAYREIVLAEASLLRSQGVNAVILLTHLGNACTSNFTYDIRTSDNFTEECPVDELTQLIDSIPEGTIDAVVQGHRHRIAHHFRKGIPYMGVNEGGRYLNFMYLTFDKDNKIKKAKIQGPVPVCEKIFQNTRKCEYLNQSQLPSAGPLVSWSFHGKKVQADPVLLETVTKKWGDKMSLYTEEILRSQVTLQVSRVSEHELGNLVTNVLHQLVTDAHFTVLNRGGFRTVWYPGIIDYEKYYNMFPFDNRLVTFSMNGTEIINTFKTINTGSDYFSAWGVKIEVDVDSSNRKTVRTVKWHNGTDIDPNGVYKGVTIAFLLNGGDQFSRAINVTYQVKDFSDIGQFRSTIKPIMKAKGTIRRNTLINPSNPRIAITRV